MGDYPEITLRLLIALLFGGLVGLERSYHGRPAGFRTHALVCLGSALLMLVTVYEGQWFTQHGPGRVTVDPTRMAQGIMTGIGFLGAGVIFKEDLTVRGLTTAASIWMTAALGILFGTGFYVPAIGGTVATLLILGLFRWFEIRMPAQFFAHVRLRIAREHAPSVDAFRALLAAHDCLPSAIHFGLGEDGRVCEFRTTIRADSRADAERLVDALMARDDVAEFTIDPTGD